MFFAAACSTAPKPPPVTEAPPVAGPPQSFHVVNEGTELKTLVYGSGSRTLVLVHGGLGIPGYMNSLGELLADEFRIVEYYQRDAAETRSNGPFTIEAMSGDLAAIVRKFSDGGRPTVIAHSRGAAPALEFAKKYPELAERIVLIAPAGLDSATNSARDQNINARLPKLVKGWKGKTMLAQTAFETARTDAEKFEAYHRRLDLNWPAYFRDKQKPENLQFARPNWAALKAIESDFNRVMKEGTLKNGLERLSLPVLHLHGTLDPMPSAPTKEALEKALPNYLFVPVEGASHFPWLDGAIRAHFISALKRSLASPAKP